MAKRNAPRTARVTIDGWATIEVIARTAGAAVCLARRTIELSRRSSKRGQRSMKPVHTFAMRSEGWWKNVHLEWVA